MPSSWDLDDNSQGNDYISYDDLLRDVRDYTGILDFTANIPNTHENASGVSTDTQVQRLVDQIRDLARRDLLAPAEPSPRVASLAKPLPGAAGGPSSGRSSPPSGGGASPPQKGLSPATVPATSRRGAAMGNNKIPWLKIPDVDYGGTFAPACRLQSICVVLAIVADLDNEMLRGRSTSLYIVMLANAPISFKVGLQGITA